MGSDAASAAASGTKPTPEASEAKIFTEKEERVLKVAWRCLKSGPPELDIEKLVKLGGFNTAKTAQNTWGTIKKKLYANADVTGEGGDDSAAAATPKTPTATPKKRGKKADADGEDADDQGASPQKKPRPTPVKKGVKAVVKKEKEKKGEEDAEATDEDAKKEDENNS